MLSLGSLKAFDWRALSLISLYVQWVCLLSLAVLCQLRYVINRNSEVVAATISFLVIQLVLIVTNLSAQWLLNNFNLQLVSTHWLLRDLLITMVLAGIVLRYFYVQHRWRMEQEAVQMAKLDALQARIRPHFLFNSLNSIACLIGYDSEKAETAVEDLAGLFRANLNEGDKLTTWEKEQALCQTYLRIEKLRLGERLTVQWDVDELSNHFMLPPLILQPLIENAVYHGIEKLPEGGVVTIKAKKLNKQQQMKIEIENPLVIPTKEQAGSGDRQAIPPVAHNGLALENIRARIESIYRDPKSGERKGTFAIESGDGVFRTTLILPLNAEPFVVRH